MSEQWYASFLATRKALYGDPKPSSGLQPKNFRAEIAFKICSQWVNEYHILKITPVAIVNLIVEYASFVQKSNFFFFQ